MSYNKFKEADKEDFKEGVKKEREYIQNKLDEYLEKNDLEDQETREEKGVLIKVTPSDDYLKIVKYEKEEEQEIEEPEFKKEEKSNIITK